MKQQRDRMAGAMLHRVAARVLSRRIVESVVIPVLADLQHESTLARTAPAWRRAFVLARGYLAFWAALGLCVAAWPARSIREDWLGRDARGPRLLFALAPRAGLLGILITLVLVAQWPGQSALQARDPWLVLLALPSVIAVTVPMAFLFGLVLAIGSLGAGPVRITPTQWLRPAVGLSIAMAVLTFGLCAWVTPQANQSYRERRVRGSIPQGSRELTLGGLQTRILEERAKGQSTAALEVEWHKMWAIPAACIVFGPLAIGLQGLGTRRRTASSFALALVAVQVAYGALRVGEQAARDGRIGPLAAMWSGDTVLALVALLLIARAPQLQGSASSRT
jgi:hypothetical protein